MSIRTTITSDFKAIDLASLADDMLAQVVADHASDRFRASNRANAAVAGAYIPYSVSVGGRTIHRGHGELFPRQQLALALRPPSGLPARARTRMPVVYVDWAWESLQASSLERVLQALGRASRTLDRAQDAAEFMRLLAAGDRTGILRFVLMRYAELRYPGAFARLDQARALWRIWRIAQTGGSLLTGGNRDSAAEPSVLAWIAAELRDRSPVDSGAYRDAHMLLADGRFLMNAAEVSEDTRLPRADEFSFTNTVPYARKIEFGKTKAGRDFVIQVPNHIYERTARDARQRFRGIADIQYEVRALIDGHQTPQRHAWKPHNRPAVRYPAIVVRF